jgi:flagellar motor switch protein FliG
MATANLHKAAVLMTSLPEPQAAKLLGRLGPKQAAALSVEVAQLRKITCREQEAVIREFAAAGRPADVSPFQCLHDMGVQDLVSLLAEEHPQTVALILSQLPPEQAALAIDAFAPERQAAVLGRIATMDPPNREIVQDVAAGVQCRLSDGGGRKPRAGLAGLVKMLNAMPPAAERTLLGHVAEADPRLLHEIRRAMFGADVAACGEWDLVGAA